MDDFGGPMTLEIPISICYLVSSGCTPGLPPSATAPARGAPGTLTAPRRHGFRSNMWKIWWQFLISPYNAGITHGITLSKTTHGWEWWTYQLWWWLGDNFLLLYPHAVRMIRGKMIHYLFICSSIYDRNLGLVLTLSIYSSSKGFGFKEDACSAAISARSVSQAATCGAIMRQHEPTNKQTLRNGSAPIHVPQAGNTSKVYRYYYITSKP